MLDIILEFTFPGREGAFLNLDHGLGLASFFVVIGYEFLLFCYFFLIKFRQTKKMYWLYYSLFFLFAAISRGLFILYDYLMPYYIKQITTNPLLPLSVYRVANFIQYLAAACMVGIIATLIFPIEETEDRTKKDKLYFIMRIVMPGIVVIIGLLFLFLPDASLLNANYFLYSDPYEVGYDVDPGISPIPSPMDGMGLGSFILNLVVTPIISFILPIIFLYLAYKSVGLIRKSSALNGFGFMFYWLGRFSKYFFSATLKPGTEEAWSGVTQNVWPAMIILLGLLFLALANMMIQQK
ncbi:MAG: hypothetical protein GF364_21620 [Candidatus Lokiarchaeota archaeon]|nr:hypothetical protein [Candidatus Lokiarchaeota archaeon]